MRRPMLNELQKMTAQAIVSIYETSTYGNLAYRSISLDPGDLGGLSYGKFNASYNSGNIYLLLSRYTQNINHITDFSAYMPALRINSNSAITDAFLDLLRTASDDVVMHVTQDQFFDTEFWQPVILWATKYQFINPLTYAILFDSFIQGAFYNVLAGAPATIGKEVDWCASYLQHRYEYISTSGNSDTRSSVYRVEYLYKLLQNKNYNLDLPISIQNIEINSDGLKGGILTNSPKSWTPPKLEDSRILLNVVPMLHGEDVKAMQTALHTTVDGEFGPGTEAAVKQFQESNNVTVDGIVGPLTKFLLIM